MEDIRQRALTRLNAAINKDIDKIVTYGSECTVIEFYFLIYLLRMVRIARRYPEDYSQAGRPEYIKTVFSVYEEALKYSIQILYKYGNRPSPICSEDSQDYNISLANKILKTTLILNSKSDISSLIQLFDVSLDGKNDRYARINMSALYENEEIQKCFQYFLRIDLDSFFHKDQIQSVESLLNSFHEHFQKVSHLFEAEFGIRMDAFIRFYHYICKTIERQMTEFEKRAPQLPNGKIAADHVSTFLLYTPHIMIKEEEIIKMLGARVRPFLNRLILSPQEVNEREIRFYALNRKPILRAITGELIVSPELFLDGLFINTHYSFLEGAFAERYKAIMSDAFLDSIVRLMRKHGYRLVRRNVELYQGNDQIGDLDLILKNNSGHTLIVEAKNHALPLNVYFKDVKAVLDRLRYLQSDWERKVKRRIEHLKNHYNKYGISEPFHYVIVSQNPEILSHYSDVLCLTLNELDTYIERQNFSLTFQQLFDIKYQQELTFTPAELSQMRKDLVTPFNWSNA